MPKFIVESVEDGMVTLGLPNSTYRNSFKVADAAGLVAGERVNGDDFGPMALEGGSLVAARWELRGAAFRPAAADAGERDRGE